MQKKLVIFILVSIFLVGFIMLSAYLYGLFRKPLDQPMVLQHRATNIIMKTLEIDTYSTVPTPMEQARVVESEKSQVCGQSEPLTVLIIGSDAAEMHGLPGADLTRLARIDFPRKKVSIFALPRDIWVDVSQLGFRNPIINNTTLGKTYYYAHENSLHEEELGKMTDSAQATAQMILDNFEVTSDHYFVIDLSQLPALVDAIGGLPIYIPERTTDPWIGTTIEAGPQILSGEQLAAYARAIPDSDFARVQRSNLILRALRQKLLDPSVWSKLPTFYNQFKKMFVTDLSPQQIYSVFCLLHQVPREEIIMAQVEPEWTSPGPSNSLLWNKNKIIIALRQLQLLS
jgi:polyisoprenyl-teichoic acid--peptidoglycan teichoic acid transferase